jgi:hypothetical protein
MPQKPLQADFAKLDQPCDASESYELVGNVFYLLAPKGIGRSKLVAGTRDSRHGTRLTHRIQNHDDAALSN